MKNNKAHNLHLRFLIVVASLVVLCVSTVLGQSSPPEDGKLVEGFLLEGKRPNFIKGQLEHIRGPNSAMLQLNHGFQNGDAIRSTDSGRAEILLNPGIYLRLDHDSRISLLDLSRDNLKLKLWSGSAILEVATIESQIRNDSFESSRQLSYEPVSVLTPTAQYLVFGGGSYRFKVDDNGNSVLSVLKGVAFVNGERIDSDMTASAAGARVVLTSEAMPPDNFDQWSRERGKALVKANHALKKSDWYKKVGSNRGYLSITDPEDAARARERLTVSADTGVVDLVENAAVLKVETSAWSKLQADERLTNGDRVRTAVESRAQFSVYPNCFLFMDGDSEIVYREVDRLVAIEIVRGSAIAILAPDDKAAELPELTIAANGAKYRLTRKGNYRVNMAAGTKPELMVFDGTKRIATTDVSRSWGSSRDVLVKKMTGDSFDLWAIRKSRLSEMRGYRRIAGIGGMWCLVESIGEYTFVPAGVEYSSPYGGKYSVKFKDDNRFERRRILSREPFPRGPIQPSRPDIKRPPPSPRP